jgi:phosphate transport system substrate-binding protein
MRTYRRLRAVVGASAVLGLMGLAGCDYGQDGDPDVIALAGSDTTEDVMQAIADSYNADANYNQDPDDLRNIKSRQTPALLVPADEDCTTARTFEFPVGPGETEPPNGSSAGRNALRADPGCYDIARSSGPPRPVGPTGDDATFEYYAFGLDAMGWASASTLAPAGLTKAQLEGIYNCTFTDWSQVGGSPGPIERYWPQLLSGTQQFALSDLIGFDPTVISGPGCPAVVLTQENSGQLIAANGDQQRAVVPYSGGNWVAQANGVAPEQRSGQTIRDLNGRNIIRQVGSSFQLATPTASDPGAPVAESNVRLVDPTPDYPAIRYVFNVVDSAGPSYTGAIRYVGFNNVENGSTSPLCRGGKAAIITQYGFGTLPNTVGPRNLAGSTCRKYTP